MNEDPNPNSFVRNPLYPWLRVILWMIPSGFVLLSSAGIFSLGNMRVFNNYLAVILWVLLNIAFVIGVGWCDYQLSSPERKRTRKIGLAILLFFIIQIFIIPLLIGAFTFAACFISGESI